MFGAEVGVTTLEQARAALRQAERRVGVAHRDQIVELTPPQPAPLTELLPGGVLPAGAAMSVLGSATLTGWLLGATQADRWIAVIGWPQLGALALTEAGVDLERLVAVPDVRGRAAAVTAALLDGVELVVVGPELQLTASERRRLLVRARQHDTTILSSTPWEGAALTLQAQARWSGPDHGDYWLRAADLSVTRHSRADGPGRTFDVARHDQDPPTVTVRRAAAAGLAG